MTNEEIKKAVAEIKSIKSIVESFSQKEKELKAQILDFMERENVRDIEVDDSKVILVSKKSYSFKENINEIIDSKKRNIDKLKKEIKKTENEAIASGDYNLTEKTHLMIK